MPERTMGRTRNPPPRLLRQPDIRSESAHPPDRRGEDAQGAAPDDRRRRTGCVARHPAGVSVRKPGTELQAGRPAEFRVRRHDRIRRNGFALVLRRPGERAGIVRRNSFGFRFSERRFPLQRSGGRSFLRKPVARLQKARTLRRPVFGLYRDIRRIKAALRGKNPRTGRPP